MAVETNQTWDSKSDTHIFYMPEEIYSLIILTRSPNVKKDEADPVDEAAGDQVLSASDLEDL